MVAMNITARQETHTRLFKTTPEYAKNSVSALKDRPASATPECAKKKTFNLENDTILIFGFRARQRKLHDSLGEFFRSHRVRYARCS